MGPPLHDSSSGSFPSQNCSLLLCDLAGSSRYLPGWRADILSAHARPLTAPLAVRFLLRLPLPLGFTVRGLHGGELGALVQLHVPPTPLQRQAC